jgi:CRISPR-associated protein Csb2
MLTIQIDILTGAYRAALPNHETAEWPPHPDRLFSALAQAWSDGGCDLVEREALEWLEKQGAPIIEADPRDVCGERNIPTVFVPPNDVKGSDKQALPEFRRRRARNFRAILPSVPTVKLNWPSAAPSTETLRALEDLTQRVASLGHSSSFVRVCIKTCSPEAAELIWIPDANGGVSLRVPYPNRLKDLERWHNNGRRPLPAPAERYRSPTQRKDDKSVESVFGAADDWFIFEDAGGFRPDLLGFVHVAKRARDSLMSYAPQPVSEVLSGHTANGAPTTKVHIAIVPLANVGWTHSTGDLLGFAVVLPRHLETDERNAALYVLAKFASPNSDGALRAELLFREAGKWVLEHVSAPSRASLRADRWCSAARIWATATPLLLDRYPEHGDVVEEARIVATACRNIGLPEPTEIEIHKHSAVLGAPSAYPSRGKKSVPDWSFPAGSRLATRPRRHVVLRFAQKVRGPVLLGAGRFYGLGLCLPMTDEDSA